MVYEITEADRLAKLEREMAELLRRSEELGEKLAMLLEMINHERDKKYGLVTGG